MSYSPELEEKLEDALVHLSQGKTVLLLFDDMIAVNDHFQATLDWFKSKGNKMARRWGQGAKMQSGWVYFVGADTHCYLDEQGEEVHIPTRGVAAEYDFRPWASELVRQVGLEARLRAKGLA